MDASMNEIAQEIVKIAEVLCALVFGMICGYTLRDWREVAKNIKAIFRGRASLTDAEELLCQALRIKLDAERCPCKYAFNFHAGKIRVASAVDYRLACLAGMENFWEFVAPCDGWKDDFLPACDKADAGDCEWRFARISDRHGETYVPVRWAITVPAEYDCVWLTPEEFRAKVHDAERKPGTGDEKAETCDGEAGKIGDGDAA